MIFNAGPVIGPQRVMRRIGAAAALALSLLACAPAAERSDAVRLLTGVVPGYTDNGACFTDFALGPLLIDPKYGTAVRDETAGASAPVTTPVMWRPGFTGRRDGSEVAVLDPAGNVVATTGRKYEIAGGYWFEHPRVFVACGFVIPR